jgi:2-phospho-L-lactate/phosphoenolpyruvate guanylyltransferase
MKIAIVIPVKSFEPKKRLSSLFTPTERKQLQIAMLEDTLQTIVKARMVSVTAVVSSDREILRFAERYGATAIREEDDSGVNSAVDRAIDQLEGYDGWLILPADLPLLNQKDIKTVLGLQRMGAEFVISPSEEYDGTNLMLVTREKRIPLHYDDDSYRNHVLAAMAAGAKVAVYYSERVGFDIDKSSDVHRYFKFGTRGNTMTFLGRTLTRSRAMQSKMREDDRKRSG